MENEASEHSAEEIEVLGDDEQRDMLFCVQNLGVVKGAGATETYVKSKECVDLLRELYKMLRLDASDNTIRKLQLAQWRVVSNDLLKLLVNYPEDLQLAFHTVLLLASLTEKAESFHVSLQEYNQALLQYKRDFIACKPALKVLVQLMANCLSKEEKNEQHDQLLELLVYLCRNLLAIDGEFMLQAQLLHRLADETALDAFIYMCQDFTNPVLKKLDFCFLEIIYLVFKDLSPLQLLRPAAFSPLQTNKLQNLKPYRHNKFGSNFKFKRQLDASAAVSMQVRDPKTSYSTQLTLSKAKIAPNLKTEHRSETRQLDESLVTKLKKFADDILQHCIGGLVNSVVLEIQRESDRMQDEDKANYFRLQAFMFEYLRESGADVAFLAEALDLKNFEVLYRTFSSEMNKVSPSDLNAKEFQAAMACCVQYLLVVRQMNGDADETTRRNAQIIMQNVFYHEMVRVCKFAFEYWKEGASNAKFLHEIAEFNYIVLRSLEDFCSGKNLTVRTDRLTKKRKAGDESDDYLSETEVIEETVYRERSLSFFGEFLHLLDSKIVHKYMILVKQFAELSENAKAGVVYYLLKVTNELRSSELLHQVEHLFVIEEVLSNPSTPQYLKEILTSITSDFFIRFRENRLLAVEILFPIKKPKRLEID